MQKMSLTLPDDIADYIRANSTERKQGELAAVLIRKGLNKDRDDGGGALERLAQAVERAVKEMERAT